MSPSAGSKTLLGRYELHAEIASGGMASVHLAALLGDVGFARVVAIKRLHPHLAKTSDFVDMFLDEARLAARIRHPNVASTIDVVHGDGELFIVMDYVEGDSIAGLTKAAKRLGERCPLAIASSIVIGALHGLQAAHEARGLDGQPLGIVHRDVSPQNILVGVDGVARLVDFGIALANVRIQTTREGQIKGKLSYMAPEQLTRDERPSVASDIYAVGVVLWEICAGARAFQASTEPALLGKVLSGQVGRLDQVAPWVPPALAEVAHRAMRIAPGERFSSAREMARALEAALPPAPAHEVGSFVERIAHEVIGERRARVAAIERGLSAPVVRAPVEAVAAAPRGLVSASAPPPSAPPVIGITPVRNDVDTATGHTVATPPSASLPRRSRAPWIALGVAAAALAGAAYAFSSVREGRAVDGRGDGSAARSLDGAAATHGSAAPAPTPAPSVTPAPVASAEPAPQPSAESTADPKPKSARSGVAKPSPRPRESARPSAKEGCDPPYYVDSAGIQRVKRACFGR